MIITPHCCSLLAIICTIFPGYYYLINSLPDHSLPHPTYYLPHYFCINDTVIIFTVVKSKHIRFSIFPLIHSHSRTPESRDLFRHQNFPSKGIIPIACRTTSNSIFSFFSAGNRPYSFQYFVIVSPYMMS